MSLFPLLKRTEQSVHPGTALAAQGRGCSDRKRDLLKNHGVLSVYSLFILCGVCSFVGLLKDVVLCRFLLIASLCGWFELRYFFGMIGFELVGLEVPLSWVASRFCPCAL